MAIENSAVKWVVIGLLVLLLIPVAVMFGMMATGSSCCGGMMGGMMSGGMFWGTAWLGLVAAGLIFLIAFLARSNSKSAGDRDKAA